MLSRPLYLASWQQAKALTLTPQQSVLRPIFTRSIGTAAVTHVLERRTKLCSTSKSTFTRCPATAAATTRNYSSPAGEGPGGKAVTAEEAASSLLSRFKGKTKTATQILDANQLWKLHLTLGYRGQQGNNKSNKKIEIEKPGIGTEIPRGHHLVYFTPADVESELSSDGSDAAFNAPWPFSRRMWAGGRMRWLDGAVDGKDVVLRVGDEVEERTMLVNAAPKKSRDGSEMVLVNVEKEFWGPRGLALVDERSWIFRPEAAGASPAAEKALRDSVIRGPSTIEDVPQDGAYPKRRLRWSPTGLFRFSALTFNGHKIHYDQAWSTAVEGHPGCVVHGPLNLINMLDYWRDHCSIDGGKVREVSYRAVAPIYAGEIYDISAQAQAAEERPQRWEAFVQKEGKTCMRGEILGA